MCIRDSAIVTKKNIENFTRQLKMLGYGFDWDRVVNTTDPSYYKWTQWIFPVSYTHLDVYKRQGVNGTTPSLMLSSRLRAALDFIADKPDIPIICSCLLYTSRCV